MIHPPLHLAVPAAGETTENVAGDFLALRGGSLVAPSRALCGAVLDGRAPYVWGGPRALRVLADALGPRDYHFCLGCLRYLDSEFPAPLDL